MNPESKMKRYMQNPKNLRPIAGGVLVRRHPPKNWVESSIIYRPDSQYYSNTECTVVAVSEKYAKGVDIQAWDYEVGDVVHVLAFEGDKVDPYDDPLLINIRPDMGWFKYPAENYED